MIALDLVVEARDPLCAPELDGVEPPGARKIEDLLALNAVRLAIGEIGFHSLDALRAEIHEDQKELYTGLVINRAQLNITLAPGARRVHAESELRLTIPFPISRKVAPLSCRVDK